MGNAIRVYGDIENNKKYKDMLDKYLASELFKDRCKELKGIMKKSEEAKRSEEIKREELKKFETMKMF